MSTPEKVQINSVLAKSLRVGCPGDAIYDEFEVTFDRREVEVGAVLIGLVQRERFSLGHALGMPENGWWIVQGTSPA
jgi:hypothetical protein